MNDNLERLIEKELKLTGEYLKCEVATLVVLSQDGYNPLFYHLNQLPSRVNRYVDATFERNRGVVEEIKEDYLLGLIKLLGKLIIKILENQDTAIFLKRFLILVMNLKKN